MLDLNISQSAPLKYKAVLSVEYFLFCVQQKQEQQEGKDETGWNSLDGQTSFEASLSAFRETHKLELFRQWYLGSHPF